MNERTTQDAIAAAERFIELAKVALIDRRHAKYGWIAGSKYTGAAKRASMDLTRALAEMRRPS